MQRIKFLALFLLLAIILELFTGCFYNRYNAKIIHNDARDMISNSFYCENYVYGACYLINDEYVTMDDISYPRYRTFVVTSKEDFDDIFTGNINHDIDFSSEMIIIYTFTSEYRRDIEIKSTRMVDNKLSIELNMKKPFTWFYLSGDACQSYQRYIIIKMDKIEFNEIVIVLNI